MSYRGGVSDRQEDPMGAESAPQVGRALAARR